MRQPIAYCGIDCSICPAYVAKRSGDQKLKEQTAAKWTSKEFPIGPSDIECDGCREDRGQQHRYCQVCDIRHCARGRSHDTCAACADYPCGNLQTLFKNVGPQPRINLDRIRSDLASP